MTLPNVPRVLWWCRHALMVGSSAPRCCRLTGNGGQNGTALCPGKGCAKPASEKKMAYLLCFWFCHLSLAVPALSMPKQHRDTPQQRRREFPLLLLLSSSLLSFFCRRKGLSWVKLLLNRSYTTCFLYLLISTVM